MPVYMIHAIGSHTYKIGQSANPRKRLAACQTGSALLLELIATTEQPSEEWWHKLFWRNRLHGEWFELGPENVEYFVKTADTVYLDRECIDAN